MPSTRSCRKRWRSCRTRLMHGRTRPIRLVFRRVRHRRRARGARGLREVLLHSRSFQACRMGLPFGRNRFLRRLSCLALQRRRTASGFPVGSAGRGRALSRVAVRGAAVARVAVVAARGRTAGTGRVVAAAGFSGGFSVIWSSGADGEAGGGGGRAKGRWPSARRIRCIGRLMRQGVTGRWR